MTLEEIDALIAPVLEHFDRSLPGDGIGVYLYGSSVAETLRASSDIDLLILTRRALTSDERISWVTLLLQLSGWRGHAAHFPDASERRPIELTSLVADNVRRWVEPARRDFQYGEWLRHDLLTGHVPQPTNDPDVVLLIANALTSHRVLRGPPLDEVVAQVPPTLLRKSMRELIPAVLEGVEGDECNALLTLARILETTRTGRIVTKDAAVDALVGSFSPADQRLLDRARACYLGENTDDWSGLTAQVVPLAERLARRALHELS